MKAAVLHQAPGELAIEDVDLDSPGPEEVLIRVVASGLCHSDLHVMEGKMPMPRRHARPRGGGVVEAVGSHVSEFTPGDHVVGCRNVTATSATSACAAGASCASGGGLTYRADGTSRGRRGEQQSRRCPGSGGFAEQMLAHRNGIVKVPKELPLDLGALLGCAVVTGVGSALTARGCDRVDRRRDRLRRNRAQHHPGRRAGRRRADHRRRPQPEKLELARMFGATDTVDAAETRSGRGGARADRRRRRRRVRGDRACQHRRPGFPDDPSRLRRLPRRRAAGGRRCSSCRARS